MPSRAYIGRLRLGPGNPNPVKDNKSVQCPRFVTMLIADFVRGRAVLDNVTLLGKLLTPNFNLDYKTLNSTQRLGTTTNIV